MNLIKFLIYGAFFMTLFGEFGHFPFGASSGAVSLTDLLVGLCFLFFLIWVFSTKQKILFPKQFVWLAAFWLTGFFALLFSLTSFPLLSVLTGSLYLFRFILYSSIFLIAYNLAKLNVLDKRALTKIGITTAVVFAALGFVQLLVLPNFDSADFSLTQFGFDPHVGRLTSTFLDPNFAGVYLVLGLGLLVFNLVTKRVKLTSLALLVFIFISLILTYSRSAYLMLAVSALLFLGFLGSAVKLKTKIFGVLGVVLLGVVGALIFPRFLNRVEGAFAFDKSASERVISWQNGLAVFSSKPFLGVGFDNLRIAQEKLNLFKTFSPGGGHAGAGIDSSLILVLATTGTVGFFIYVIFWLAIFKSLVKNNVFTITIFSLMVGLLVGSQFVNALFYPALMLWYFSFLGVSINSPDS